MSFSKKCHPETDGGAVRLAEWKDYVSEKHMPYVTSVERIAQRKV